MAFRIVYREEWKGQIPQAHTMLEAPVDHVICMATRGTPCYNDAVCKITVRKMQTFHMKHKHMHDIRFSFLIGGSGLAYEGRGWHNAPLLPSKYSNINQNSILIGFMGTIYEGEIPQVMVQARDNLVSYGILNNYINKDCKRWEILDRRPPDVDDAIAEPLPFERKF